MIMKFLRNLKIREKITIVISVLVLGSLILFVCFATTIIRNETIKTSKTAVQENLFVMKNSIDFLISSVDDSIANISIDRKLHTALQDYYDGNVNIEVTRKLVVNNINEVVGVVENIIGCDIVTKEGELINLSPITYSDAKKLVHNDCDLNVEYKAYEWNGPFKVVHKSGLEKNIFVVRKKIYTLDKPEYLGCLYVYIDENMISEILSAPLNESDKHYYLIDDQNVIISVEDKKILGSYFSDAFNLMNNFFYEIEIDKSITVNNEYYNINDLSEKNYRIISRVSMTSLLEASTSINRFLLIFTFVYFLLMFIIPSKLARSITKPITDLVLVMRSIRKGKTSMRASNYEANHEIGLLNDTFNNLMDDNQKLIEDIFEKQKEIRSQEFKVLQEQIKPHFLYNTLGTISSLIKLELYNDANNTIQNLASFFRIYLNEGNDSITVREELKLIENYLVIQKYRYKIIDYNIEVDESLMDIKIPKLILQPIVENAIYHGLKPNGKDGLIRIGGYKKRSKVYFLVEDNGVGLDENDLKRLKGYIRSTSADEGYGLRNINQRVKILFGENFGLKIESQLGVGSKFTVVLPLQLDSLNTY